MCEMITTQLIYNVIFRFKTTISNEKLINSAYKSTMNIKKKYVKGHKNQTEDSHAKNGEDICFFKLAVPMLKTSISWSHNVSFSFLLAR